MSYYLDVLISGNYLLSNYSHCMQSFRRFLRKFLMGKCLGSGICDNALLPARHTSSSHYGRLGRNNWLQLALLEMQTLQ